MDTLSSTKTGLSDAGRDSVKLVIHSDLGFIPCPTFRDHSALPLIPRVSKSDFSHSMGRTKVRSLLQSMRGKGPEG